MENLNPEFHVLLQSMLALLFGGLIGWEREAAGKWAGIRTHMLVCLSTLLFVRVGEFLMATSVAKVSNDILQADPLRIVEAVVTGLAFIGAGTVFRDPSRNVTRGLTTAASLLTVAPIGMAIAVERYVLAFGATVLLFLVLRGVGWLEGKSFEDDRRESQKKE